MNENAKLWVKALRSGEYKQATMRLGIPEVGYCCMGVACEVYIKAGNALEKHHEDNAIVYDGQRAVLPDSVVFWLNLKNQSGLVGTGKGELTAMNDGGKTFEELADFIEKTPELFNVK